MSWNPEELRRRNEEIRARFEKLAEEMPCSWVDSLDESVRCQVEQSDREKCLCPGCAFRRMIARFGQQPRGEREELVAYPTTSELQGAFSGLLATVEGIRKYDRPSDSGLALLEQSILNSLGELRIQAERTERGYRVRSQPVGVANRNLVLRGPNTTPSPRLAERIKVGSKLRVSMIGMVQNIDGDSVLVRYEMPGLSRDASF